MRDSVHGSKENAARVCMRAIEEEQNPILVSKCMADYSLGRLEDAQIQWTIWFVLGEHHSY